MWFEMNQTEWMMCRSENIPLSHYILDHVSAFSPDRFERHSPRRDSIVHPRDTQRSNGDWQGKSSLQCLWSREIHGTAIDVLFHHDKYRQSLSRDGDQGHKTTLFRSFDQRLNPIRRRRENDRISSSIDQHTLLVSSTTLRASPEICRTALICLLLCCRKREETNRCSTFFLR